MTEATIKRKYVNEFNDSKIYKISNSVNPKVYVGSTTRDLHVRLIEHRSKAKNNKYTSSIIINEDPNNCKIELIEVYPCSNLSRLKAREAYWSKKLDSINAHTPNKLTLAMCGGSLEEWCRKYRNEGFKCPCGGKYTRINKTKHEKTEKHQKYLNQQ